TSYAPEAKATERVAAWLVQRGKKTRFLSMRTRLGRALKPRELKCVQCVFNLEDRSGYRRPRKKNCTATFALSRRYLFGRVDDETFGYCYGDLASAERIFVN